jgi:uncharacterized protein (DUF111 family)
VFTESASPRQRIVLLEEIDDMNLQVFGHVMERLYAAGAFVCSTPPSR